MMLLCFAAIIYGCGNNSPESVRQTEEGKSNKADYASLVKETDRMISGDEKEVKPREKRQEDTVTKGNISPTDEAVFDPALAGHDLDFYFPTQFEEDNYLEILGEDICDPETVARRERESAGLVSCATWKARLKKAKTMLKIGISRYENEATAWEAINRMRSTGGFIAGDVILTGDEEWPATTEGQIEARSFIKSYYGRIRPTYVFKNEKGAPENYLLENDRELEALGAGK